MESYNKALKVHARQLRNNPTDAEAKLWRHLRRKQILGTQFNRQKPILNYIVDFYCAKAKLVIELDGSQHLTPENKHKDEQRDLALKTLGLKVMRFHNREVLLEMEAVMEKIFLVVDERLKSPPAPLC